MLIPRVLHLVFILGVAGSVLLSSSPSVAKPRCTVPLKELSPGVSEGVLGELRFKLENGTRVAKMKLVGLEGLVEEWTSVSLAGGPGKISGFVEKDGAQYLYAELIAIQRDTDIEWALFKNERLTVTGGSGTAYFSARGETRCLPVTVAKWARIAQGVLGSTIVEASSIRIPYRSAL